MGAQQIFDSESKSMNAHDLGQWLYSALLYFLVLHIFTKQQQELSEFPCPLSGSWRCSLQPMLTHGHVLCLPLVSAGHALLSTVF